jgi:hypothetical protein
LVFDHRPPLALRDKADEVNDPDRLAAIFWTCDQQKTPGDLREIARTKRLAETYQSFLERQREKVAGRRVPSRRQWSDMQKIIGRCANACQTISRRNEANDRDGADV